MKARDILKKRRDIETEADYKLAINQLPSIDFDHFRFELRDHSALVLIINGCNNCGMRTEYPMSIETAEKLFKWGHDLFS